MPRLGVVIPFPDRLGRCVEISKVKLWTRSGAGVPPLELVAEVDIPTGIELESIVYRRRIFIRRFGGKFVEAGGVYDVLSDVVGA